MLSREELTRTMPTIEQVSGCLRSEQIPDLRREEKLEAENSALKAKLAELDATLDRADKHTEWMLERLEALQAENAALKAQLANAEREAVEGKRRAWDEAMTWACETWIVVGHGTDDADVECDRRYPLPKEEGR